MYGGTQVAYCLKRRATKNRYYPLSFILNKYDAAIFYFYIMQQLDLFGNPIGALPKKPKQIKKTDPEPDVEPVAEQPIAETVATVAETTSHTNESAITEEMVVTVPELPVEQVEDLLTDSNISPEKEVDNELPTDFVLTNSNDAVISDIEQEEQIVEPAIVEELLTEPVKTHTETVATPGKRGRKSYKSFDNALDIEVPDEATLQKKLYYSISEVATWFKVNTSQIRFWENEFDILKPRKNRKGDRLFRVEDIKNLVLIHYLLRNRKFSIEGAKDYLKNHKQAANRDLAMVQSLQKIRSFLLELKANLDA